jgi:hypothetical protein
MIKLHRNLDPCFILSKRCILKRCGKLNRRYVSLLGD